MKDENLSSAEGFFIVGFSDNPQLCVPLFVTFLLVYLITLVGNLLIMTTIYSNPHLHTPMYFFLTTLSFLDISYTTVFFPQMLAHFFQEGTHISLSECMVQAYFCMFMVSTELLLLTVIPYDQYVAICNPLRYLSIMKKTVCLWMAAGCWGFSFITPLPHTFLMSKLNFCGSHTINHFFCDVTILLKMSCSNTGVIEALTYVFGSLELLASFLIIIVSYSNIISSILKIKSKGGRHKAFSTCASHLTVVSLFYGSLCSTYVRPASSYSLENNKILSLSYIALTPMLNPIIYTLKNTEFKNALRKAKNTE